MGTLRIYCSSADPRSALCGHGHRDPLASSRRGPTRCRCRAINDRSESGTVVGSKHARELILNRQVDRGSTGIRRADAALHRSTTAVAGVSDGHPISTFSLGSILGLGKRRRGRGHSWPIHGAGPRRRRTPDGGSISWSLRSRHAWLRPPVARPTS